MEGYRLSKSWFNWAFENPDKISPGHTAVYFFAIECANRMEWKETFGFPSAYAMEALGIKKHETYMKYLSDLEQWGFIKVVKKSKNQYTATIISLNCAHPKNGNALGKANHKHGESTGESNGESEGVGEGYIKEPITYNLEPITYIPPISPTGELQSDDKKQPSGKFSKPTVEEVEQYVLSKHPDANQEGVKLFAEKFWSFYENNGWKAGKNKMKDFRLAITQWKDTLTKMIYPSGQQIPAFQQKVTPNLPNHKRGIVYSRSGAPGVKFRGNYNEYMDAVGCFPEETLTILSEYVIN